MNKLNFIKTLICTLVIFSLASCGVKETTGTGGGGAIDYGYDVSFALGGTTNFSAITGTSATYTYASNETITLTAIKTNFRSSTNTNNFFRYTVSPANVISISTNTTTNRITFALTNMKPGSVRITAIATNNLGHTNGQFSYTINLRKANYPTPPIVYITTNQTNIAGFVLTYAVLSDTRTAFSSTTAFNRISGNATAGISTNGTVTVTNGTSSTSTFEVKLTSPNYVDYMVHIQSVVPPSNNNGLQTIIEGGNLVTLLGSTNTLATNILVHLTGSENYASATITAIYVTETGSGDYSGTHWTNSVAATNLRNKINGITDASASKVYAVLVAGGTYKPTIDTDRSISFSMKNHVAIIGGFDATGSWELTGTTTFSGDIGTANDNTDNTYQVFSHNSVTLDNALLYGVTISDGRANGTTFLFDVGGGMYNTGSSPRLFNVVFTGNSAIDVGGGMYNNSSSPRLFDVVFTGNSAVGGGGLGNTKSSPVLTEVSFIGNSARGNGGGMHNNHSSPRLFNVVFSNNSAAAGAGMHNISSAPALMGVVFSRNSTEYDGGGMLNSDSSPVLIGVVFNGNSSGTRGGGMFNNNDGQPGPLIVNTIFAGNTALTGQDIGMYLDSAAGETIRIAGSVLGIGESSARNGIVAVGNTGVLNLTYHGLANGAVNFGPNATLGGFTYPTIQSTSSAVDIGLYVRRSGTDYYFSEDKATWYTNFTTTGVLTGPAGTPPTGAEDLTARDIAGNARVGRPDAGVYEYKP